MTIRFGTDGWRAIIADGFTFDAVRAVARALAAYLWRESDGGRPTVVIGYDRRFASDEFARAASEELVARGLDVLLSRSAITTPNLSYTTLESKSQAGLMITASHNPATYNGIKLKGKRGGAASTAMLRAVEAELSSDQHPEHEREFGQMTEIDPIPAYLDRLGREVDVSRIRSAGLTIVVDSMFGSTAGLMARIVGNDATQIVELNALHNPLFPGISGPEPVERNLARLKKVVGDGGANIGIAFDGDGDRIGVVNEHGEYVSSQHVFALLTRYILHHRGRHGPIVKSVTGSTMINVLGETSSVPVIETATGFTNISQTMIERSASIGGEESGGFAFGFHLPDRDGLLAALLLVDYTLQSGMSVSDLINDLESAIGKWRFRRVDLPLSRESRAAVEERLGTLEWPGEVASLRVKDVVQTDGTRVEFVDGSWLLIRNSGTEPLLRVYAESHDAETVDALLLGARTLVGV
ncbi:MAG TPA: phosphoglucomutase/phosphomannomutase family protein [Nitrolancea sp.]|nr:phosphoglucomutase/phosphomannomutase family protein [Nitrolancea sp.]